MNIHDLIFTGGSIIFILSLIPSVLSEHKPAFWTSILTGTVLAVFVLDYYTISYWFSGTTTAITALIWFVLAIQGRKAST